MDILKKIQEVKRQKDEFITPNNVRAGITVFGIEGNLEPDKPDQSKTVTPSTEQQKIYGDKGYELGEVVIEPVTSSIDSNIQPENIKKNTTILGVTGTLEENEDLEDVLTSQEQKISDIKRILLSKGQGDGGSLQLNLFAQPTEPETKRGIWIKTDEPIDVQSIAICNKDNIVNPLGVKNFKTTDLGMTYDGGKDRMVVLSGQTLLFGCGDDHKTVLSINPSDNTITNIATFPHDLTGAIVGTYSNYTIFVLGGVGDPTAIYEIPIANGTMTSLKITKDTTNTLAHEIIHGNGIIKCFEHNVYSYEYGGSGSGLFQNGTYMVYLCSDGGEMFKIDDSFDNDIKVYSYHTVSKETEYDGLSQQINYRDYNTSTTYTSDYNPSGWGSNTYYLNAMNFDYFDKTKYKLFSTSDSYYSGVNLNTMAVEIKSDGTSDVKMLYLDLSNEMYGSGGNTGDLSYSTEDYGMPAKYTNGNIIDTYYYGDIDDLYRYFIFGTEENPTALIGTSRYYDQTDKTYKWKEAIVENAIPDYLHNSYITLVSASGFTGNFTAITNNQLITFTSGVDATFGDKELVIINHTSAYNMYNKLSALIPPQGIITSELEVGAYDIFFSTKEGGLNRNMEIHTARYNATSWGSKISHSV